MPYRTKHEAELRMAMAVAFLSARQDKCVREGLRAVKAHLATVRLLNAASLPSLLKHTSISE